MFVLRPMLHLRREFADNEQNKAFTYEKLLCIFPYSQL